VLVDATAERGHATRFVPLFVTARVHTGCRHRSACPRPDLPEKAQPRDPCGRCRCEPRSRIWTPHHSKLTAARERLDPHVKQRVLAAIERLVRDPAASAALRWLTGRTESRMRAGD
jgi:hypothetical protein